MEKETINEQKMRLFSQACNDVRAAIKEGFSVSQAITLVVKHYGSYGVWDSDDLAIELSYMGFCEVDSYNY